MNLIRLCVGEINSDDINPRNYNNIWGNFCIKIDDIFFPNQEWYDAVSSILDMWLAQITDFVNNRKLKCTLYFMDGPFSLQLHYLTSEEVEVSCQKNDGVIIANASITLQELICEITSATQVFLDNCNSISRVCPNEVFLRLRESCCQLKKWIEDHDT